MAPLPPVIYPGSFPAATQTLLDRLHDASSTQEASISATAMQHIRSTYTTSPEESKRLLDDAMRDKFIALDKDKALFVYNLIVASGSTRVVEIGTSYGVSTIWLAEAVRESAKIKMESEAKVIATEKEQSKAMIAQSYWKEAGNKIEEVIDLRVGDLLETIGHGWEDVGRVDFVLLDIWPNVALPALKLLLPKLRSGAIVVTDNSLQSAEGYTDLLNVLRDPNGHFQSATLPFKGGLEFSVYRAMD